jgi:hypothetical protein
MQNDLLKIPIYSPQIQPAVNVLGRIHKSQACIDNAAMAR